MLKSLLIFVFSLILLCISNESNSLPFKEKKEPIDSLFGRDIREMEKIYGKLKVYDDKVGEPSVMNNPNQTILRYVKVKYPESAKDNGIQGFVYARFVIDTLGKAKELKILKGIGGGCDQEVLRALTELNSTSYSVETISGKKTPIYQKIRMKFRLR